MKGYTVFNVEQIDGLPERFYAKAAPGGETGQRIARVVSLSCRDRRECPARRQSRFLEPGFKYVQMALSVTLCGLERQVDHES
jgi:antirestriction protein ArdC